MLAVSLSGQTTFSDFAVDVKSHSTARIGWTTNAVIDNWNMEWDTQATPPFANATSYRNDSSGPTWYYGYFTAGNPTSIYVPYGHGCRTGYKLLVSGATGGWAPLNGVRTCTYTDANHFTAGRGHDRGLRQHHRNGPVSPLGTDAGRASGKHDDLLPGL